MKNIIKQYNTTAAINNRNLTVTVVIEAFDDSPMLEGGYDFGDAKANEAYAERFRSGELQCVGVVVKAYLGGLEGFDSVGACHVASNTFEQDVMQTVTDYGMEANAIQSLKDSLEALLKEVS